MKNFFALLLCLSLYGVCGAQTFQKVYGDSISDNGVYFFPSADSGFYLLTTGRHYSSRSQFSILKIDQSGDSLSSINIPDSIAQGQGYCMNCTDQFVTSSAKVTMIGTNQFLDTLYIYRTDTLGNRISTWTYPDTLTLFITKILHTSDGGYLISAGNWNSQYSAYILFMKLDSAGNVQWKENVLPYSISEEFPIDLLETSDHFYLAEISQASGSNWTGNKVMMKLDTSGNVLWSTSLTYGYAAGYNQQMVAVDSGYLYIDNTGYSNSSTFNSRISMVDTGGVLRWSKICDDMSVSYSNIQLNHSGGFYLCGRKETIHAYNADIIFTSLDNSADSITSFSFGLDSTFIFPYLFRQLNDGRLAVVGLYSSHSYRSSPNSDIYFAVSDTLGNISSVFGNSYAQNRKEIIIYPNPTTGQFSIKELPFIVNLVEIFNSLGEKVFSERLNETRKTLNANLERGIYFICVSDGKSRILKKLIVD